MESVGTVSAVNDDGTVTVWVRGGLVESLPADPSYYPRVVGDRVRVRLTLGQAFVLGKGAGPLPADPAAPTIWRHTLADTAPGAPFVEAASVWVDPVTAEVRYVRAVPAPPPTNVPGTLTRAVTGLATYRGGAMVGDDRAEQGTWGGYGPHTGLFLYGAGAWTDLAGATITRVRARFHRTSNGGIIAATPIYVGYHNSPTAPGAAGPGTLAETEARLSLARNESKTIDLPVAWGERFRDGTAAGVGVYHAQDNAELDQATITIDYVR